jgi:hypothetical protein
LLQFRFHILGEETLQLGAQQRSIDGFGDISVEAARERPFAVTPHREGCQGNYRKTREAIIAAKARNAA